MSIGKNFCFRFHLGCAAHEVVEEVVGELDQVHDRLGALQDLAVQRGLDVRLKRGQSHKVKIVGFPPKIKVKI